MDTIVSPKPPVNTVVSKQEKVNNVTSTVQESTIVAEENRAPTVVAAVNTERPFVYNFNTQFKAFLIETPFSQGRPEAAYVADVVDATQQLNPPLTYESSWDQVLGWLNTIYAAQYRLFAESTSAVLYNVPELMLWEFDSANTDAAVLIDIPITNNPQPPEVGTLSITLQGTSVGGSISNTDTASIAVVP